MARRAKNAGAGDAVVPLFFICLPTIIAAIYIGSIAYALILLIALLYYGTLGANRLKENTTKYASALSELSGVDSDVQSLESEFSDLRKTQSGAYDERSYRGKDANVKKNQLLEKREGILAELTDFVSTYRNAIFFRVATVAWFVTIAIFFIYALNPEWAPAWAMLASVMAGTFYRMGSPSIVSTPPSLSGKISALFLAIWFVGCAIWLKETKPVDYYAAKLEDAPKTQQGATSSVEVETNTYSPVSSGENGTAQSDTKSPVEEAVYEKDVSRDGPRPPESNISPNKPDKCKPYTTTDVKVSGIACLQEDGTWKIQSTTLKQ